jgi:methionyl-tRNA synthetase
MLLSIGTQVPKNILVQGIIKNNGVKMGKSLGNVVNFEDIISEYNSFGIEKSVLGESFGKDVFRFFVLKQISPYLDGTYSNEEWKKLYNGELANGLGNLINRTVKLCEKYLQVKNEFAQIDLEKDCVDFANAMKVYDVMTAMNSIWKLVNSCDEYMQKNEPFKVIKVDEEAGKKHLEYLRDQVYTIARLLNPFMPTTSEMIKKIVKENKMPEKPLFPRYE